MGTVGCGKPSNRTAKSGSDPEWGVAPARVQFSTGVCLSGFLLSLRTCDRPCCRGTKRQDMGDSQYCGKALDTGRGGEDSAPGERLSDMCGSVQHAKVYPFFRRARLCSPSSIDAEKDSIDMSKKKRERNQRRKDRFLDYLQVKSMELDWIAFSKGLDDNTLASMLFRQSNAFLKSTEWRELRLEAIKKYGSSCLRCGRKDGPNYPINIDHIKPRKFYPQLALDIDNLQPLCEPCNKNKGNGKPVDYRWTKD